MGLFKKKKKLSKIEKINNKSVKMYAVAFVADIQKYMKLTSQHEAAVKEGKEEPTPHAITLEEAQQNQMALLCVVPTFIEASEFLSRYIIEHEVSKEHYKLWCENHKLDGSLSSTRFTYIDTVVGFKEAREKYGIIDIHYSYKDLALILRMTSGYQPLGCTFEDPIEQDMARQREAYKKIEEELAIIEKSFRDVAVEAQNNIAEEEKVVNMATTRKKPGRKPKNPPQEDKK